MTYEEFNEFCHALPATTYVVQWGGSHVWKVGGKVFAIGGWQDGEPSFTFKVTGIGFEILKDQPGFRPAPYLASRGMTWIQHFAKPGLSDDELKAYIRQSYLIVAQGLSKKKQKELGLNTPEPALPDVTTPHPVLLPVGEGTPEQGVERATPFPLPMGEGRGER
jgi:predicted DNA-binding protein (MmcQ/YjbR family)